MTSWNVLRAAGVAAYLALFLSTAWGLLSTTSLVTKRVARSTAAAFHATVASAGMAFLAVHVVGLSIHHLVLFDTADLLIPFRSTYRPIANAFGIVAMYAMVIVLASSWVRKRIGTAWWRRVHLLAVPTFTLSLLHGLFAGTDSGRPWMFAMYVVTGLSTLSLVIVRAVTVASRPPREARERLPVEQLS